MLWFTLFLLCIALEIITGTGWLLLISLGALSSAIMGFFFRYHKKPIYVSLRQSAYWRR